MPDLFRSALTLSLTSLGVTFLALGLFALLIVTLREGFSAPGRDPVRAGLESTSGSEEELAAVIGLAVHLTDRKGPAGSDLGAALLRGPGPYWTPPRLTGRDRMPRVEDRDD